MLRLSDTGSSNRLVQGGCAAEHQVYMAPAGYHLRLPEGQYICSPATIRRRYDVFLRATGRRGSLQPARKESVLCDPRSTYFRLSACLRWRRHKPDVLLVVGDVIYYVTGRRLSYAGDIAPSSSSPASGATRARTEESA